MAKSKYAPALFEVIHSRQDAESGSKVSLPKWWKREASAEPTSQDEQEAPAALIEPSSGSEPQPQADEPGRPVRDAVTAAPPPPVVEPVREVPRHSATAADELVEAPPVVQVREGRLALSLNPVSAAVVIGVALIALFTSYQLGRSSGYGAGSRSAAAPVSRDEVDQMVNGPARPEVLKAPAPQKAAKNTPAPTARPPAPQAASVKPPVEAAPAAAKAAGHYVVLERFKTEHGQAAEFAQKWLGEQGYKTRLDRRSDGWRLIGEQTFADDAQLKKYVEAMPQVGKALGTALGRAGLPIYYMKSPMTVREK